MEEMNWMEMGDGRGMGMDWGLEAGRGDWAEGDRLNWAASGRCLRADLLTMTTTREYVQLGKKKQKAFVNDTRNVDYNQTIQFHFLNAIHSRLPCQRRVHPAHPSGSYTPPGLRALGA